VLVFPSNGSDAGIPSSAYSVLFFLNCGIPIFADGHNAFLCLRVRFLLKDDGFLYYYKSAKASTEEGAAGMNFILLHFITEHGKIDVSGYTFTKTPDLRVSSLFLSSLFSIVLKFLSIPFEQRIPRCAPTISQRTRRRTAQDGSLPSK
jgi:hypothetical protein